MVKLKDRVKKTLEAFAKDYQEAVKSKSDKGIKLADQLAYQYVDSLFFEDIAIRAAYTEYYEGLKKTEE